MDLLAQYSDGEDDGNDGEEAAPAKPQDIRSIGAFPKAAAKPQDIKSIGALPKQRARPVADAIVALPSINAAPEVDLVGSNPLTALAIDPKERKIFTNPSIGVMDRPLLGPVEVGKQNLEQKFQNHRLGHVEKASVSQFSFDEQYHTFHNFGYAANPAIRKRGEGDVLHSTEGTVQLGRTIWDKSTKRQRLAAGELGADDCFAERVGDSLKSKEAASQWGGFVDADEVRKDVEEELKARAQELVRLEEEERAVEGEERETKERVTSVFHGTKETDYAGRSWIENKVNVTKDVDDKQCFLPKKWIHTWSGHTMGVQAIRWFPETAHLLLSAGLDSKVKIWDYHNQRKCLRTYMGHDQAVRDIQFTADGKQFYSVSYDKNIQYWDTETGQVILTFTNKKTPLCVAVHPDLSQQNVIITGHTSKKAVQWDAKSGAIVQEYDEHLGAVNTVTICEEGRRLVTTSDDKKIFCWEFGIPVVIKYIAEPTMHSVPAMTMSPDKKWMIGQAMDNKIITYEAFGRFKFNGRKEFKGHTCAGYAIRPNFSADQRWIMSGDIDGKLWFWDWQKGKNYRVLKAHDGVCMDCMWHPKMTSRVVTCGWDGQIKLWD